MLESLVLESAGEPCIIRSVKEPESHRKFQLIVECPGDKLDVQLKKGLKASGAELGMTADFKKSFAVERDLKLEYIGMQTHWHGDFELQVKFNREVPEEELRRHLKIEPGGGDQPDPSPLGRYVFLPR